MQEDTPSQEFLATGQAYPPGIPGRKLGLQLHSTEEIFREFDHFHGRRQFPQLHGYQPKLKLPEACRKLPSQSIHLSKLLARCEGNRVYVCQVRRQRTSQPGHLGPSPPSVECVAGCGRGRFRHGDGATEARHLPRHQQTNSSAVEGDCDVVDPSPSEYRSLHRCRCIDRGAGKHLRVLFGGVRDWPCQRRWSLTAACALARPAHAWVASRPAPCRAPLQPHVSIRLMRRRRRSLFDANAEIRRLAESVGTTPSRPNQMLRLWVHQLSSAMRYLHTLTPEPVIFRNLKSTNVMIADSGWRIAVTDFASAPARAALLPARQNSPYTSRHRRAPLPH